MAGAGTMTDYEEIQEAEMAALRAIFMEDFEEKHSKGVWNVSIRHFS